MSDDTPTVGLGRIPGEPVAVLSNSRHNAYYLLHDDGRTWGTIGPVFPTIEDAEQYWRSHPESSEKR